MIYWVSYNPGICTAGMHLTDNLGIRLSLTGFEQDEISIPINKALLPNAHVLQGDWVMLEERFMLGSNNTCDSIVHNFPTQLRNGPLSMAKTHSPINGIDLHFDEETSFPIVTNIHSSFDDRIRAVTCLESRLLQFFVALWPISRHGCIPLTVDITTLEAKLKHCYIVGNIRYAPRHGDAVAAHRLMILGNH